MSEQAVFAQNLLSTGPGMDMVESLNVIAYLWELSVL
jgi:hypothetical protein